MKNYSLYSLPLGICVTALLLTSAAKADATIFRTPGDDARLTWLIDTTRTAGVNFDELVPGQPPYDELWYRDLRFDAWQWQGLSRRTIDRALARIIASDARRDPEHFSDDSNQWDTFADDRNGSWTRVWVQAGDRAMRAARRVTAKNKRAHYLQAATLYNIASYPHLHGNQDVDRAYRKRQSRLSIGWPLVLFMIEYFGLESQSLLFF